MQTARIANRQGIEAVTGAPYSNFMRHTSVLAALQDVAACHAERTAIRALAHADDVSPRRWNYSELTLDITRAAALFQRLAGASTPRVALLLPPLPEAWLGLWGAEAAGMACPINHALDEVHLAALLNATQATIVLTMAPGMPTFDMGERVLRLLPNCPAVKQVLSVGGAAPSGWLDFNTALAQQDAAAFRSPEQDPHRVVALFHTGGTTGLPKLAQHTQANQLHAAWGAAQMYAATEQDAILNGFPLFHVAGAFVYGLSMLLSGAEVLLPPPLGWRDAAFVARAWALVREHRVTLLATVPTVMSALLAAPRIADDSASVRLLLTGGSPLPSELALRFEAQTNIPVRNILGMTECAGVISIEPAQAPRVPGSCGLTLPFTEVQAYSAEGRALPANSSGVLRVRGPNVGPGYTDAARNPGTYQDGWLITGDIGHVDIEGRVFVTGRAKDVIIRGAHNIDPGVIEDALLLHPAVAMAAAVGAPDDYAGELPVAFVMLRPDVAATAAELLAHASSHVPERAACPKHITVLPALPLTAIGKIYKPALRALATQQVLDERLAQSGLAAKLRLHVEDRSGQLVLRFSPAANETAAALAEPLRRMMAGFALTYEMSEAPAPCA